MRGLKFKYFTVQKRAKNVAPFVGAGIEIGIGGIDIAAEWVAPFVGAGIEINSVCPNFFTYKSSHPSWVRGLK
mgnify:CR=1 FL=1